VQRRQEAVPGRRSRQVRQRGEQVRRARRRTAGVALLRQAQACVPECKSGMTQLAQRRINVSRHPTQAARFRSQALAQNAAAGITAWRVQRAAGSGGMRGAAGMLLCEAFCSIRTAPMLAK